MANPCRLKVDAARARIARLGTSQTALAAACGFELRTLQRWLAGGRVSLADAERLAAALGLGTEELFDGVPPEPSSPFERLRPLVRLLGHRDGPLAQALRLTFEHFELVDRVVSFSAHPPRGFVHRFAFAEGERRGFRVLHVDAAQQGVLPLRLAFHTQVGRRFRYEFGEVVAKDGEARLVEHFHTRAMRAPLDAHRRFAVFVWVPAEMRELVVIADRDARVERAPDPPRDLFDLRVPEAKHAVCFRPSTMHLREAGLPPTFDRVVGPREGRVDHF